MCTTVLTLQCRSCTRCRVTVLLLTFLLDNERQMTNYVIVPERCINWLLAYKTKRPRNSLMTGLFNVDIGHNISDGRGPLNDGAMEDDGLEKYPLVYIRWDQIDRLALHCYSESK